MSLHDKQPGSAKPRSTRTLWLWVILAFIVLISAWTTLVIIAKRNQPQKIEIEETDH